MRSLIAILNVCFVGFSAYLPSGLSKNAPVCVSFSPWCLPVVAHGAVHPGLFAPLGEFRLITALFTMLPGGAVL